MSTRTTKNSVSSSGKRRSLQSLYNQNVPSFDENTIEVMGLAEDFGYQRNRRNRFDDSQEGELQLTSHGMFNTQLGNQDF